MPKTNDYDAISPFYDVMAKLALRRSYILSKRLYFDTLHKGDSVLMIGGGTGQNLNRIMERIGKMGKLYFIEASEKMTLLAKKQLLPQYYQNVQFIKSSQIEKSIPDIIPDIIITQYFLDVLTDNQIHLLFQNLTGKSNSKTKWIFVDFYPVKTKIWLVTIMIWMFKVLVNHPRNDLPSYDCYFNHYGWKALDIQELDQGLIKGKLFQLEV